MLNRGKVVKDHINYNGPVLDKDNLSLYQEFHQDRAYTEYKGKDGRCYMCQRIYYVTCSIPKIGDYKRKGRHDQMVSYELCMTCQGRFKTAKRLGYTPDIFTRWVMSLEAKSTKLGNFDMSPFFEAPKTAGVNVYKLSRIKPKFLVEIEGVRYNVDKFSEDGEFVVITLGTKLESSGQGAFLPEPSLRDPQEELPTGKVLGAKSFADMMQGYDEQEEIQEEDEETQAPSPESQALVNSIISSW